MHNHLGSAYYMAASVVEQLKEQGKKEKAKISVIKLKQYLKETT